MKKMMLTVVLLAFVLAGANSSQKDAANSYQCTMKGTSKSMTGDKFKFTAQGTMSWDADTGVVSFNVTTSVQMTFQGDGIMAMNQKTKDAYAETSFNSDTAQGQALFTGKFNKDKSKFKGKFQAASPNRLGVAPGGFVYTTGTVTATLQ